VLSNNVLSWAWREKGDNDRAIAYASRAIDLDPKSSVGYHNRGNAWFDIGDYDKALADYNKALELKPSNPLDLFCRGNTWVEKGELKRAIADFDEALRLKPRDAAVIVDRGRAWRRLGEYDKALADYQEALRLDAKNVSAHQRLAWLQATCSDKKYRDGNRALVNAQHALDLTKGTAWQWVAMDAVAAAYAETGDFDLAREWATRALSAAKEEKDKLDIRRRLQLYEHNTPFRDEPESSTDVAAHPQPGGHRKK
jgi:tetratricopeptide (TPR) repeat protein